MYATTGKFIVIDGTDGSGKTTQLKLLKEALERDGYAVAIADFPQYNTKSAGPIEEYLSGKYGSAEEVDSYKASIIYAVDRYDASFQIKKWLAAGYIVLANRYTSANMGHQGGKIKNPLERKVFFNWLYDLEYKIFEIPRPDLTIILHVEAAIAQELALSRTRQDWNGKTADIHENNLEHLKHAEAIYLEIAETFPDFRLIRCTRNQEILNRDDIGLLVLNAARKIIGVDKYTNTSFQPIGNIIGTNQQIINKREALFNDRPKNIEKHIAESTNPGYLSVEKISASAKLPEKANPGDAGYDLFAANYYSIAPYGQALVATGLKLAIPEGYTGLIWDKSGLAVTGITTLGGVIDSGYRGEIKVIVKNLSEDVFNITAGQKIAQIIIQPSPNFLIKEEKIDEQTVRQNGGFGSSGLF